MIVVWDNIDDDTYNDDDDDTKAKEGIHQHNNNTNLVRVQPELINIIYDI